MQNDQRRKITSEQVPLRDLLTSPDNPRKIEPKEMERLKDSLLKNGDFAVLVINEKNEVVSGNQRLEALRELEAEGRFFTEDNPEHLIDCKRLTGFSEYELKRITLEANASRGAYDLEKLTRYLEGTDLLPADFNISAKLYARTQNKEEPEEDDFADDVKALQPQMELPLVVAVDEDEWHAFQAYKNKMGLIDDHVAVANLIARFLRIEKAQPAQGNDSPPEDTDEEGDVNWDSDEEGEENV